MNGVISLSGAPDAGTAPALDNMELRFGAAWAQHSIAWIVLAVAAVVVTAVFYYRVENRYRGIRGGRLLTLLRAAMLGVLVLILADPFLRLSYVRFSLPELWVLFDTTESMSIADPQEASESASEPRLTQVRQAWESVRPTTLAALRERVELRGFRLAGAGGAAPLTGDSVGNWSDQLWPEGDITPLGTAFDQFASQGSGGFVAAAIIVSDFDNNAGPDPLSSAGRWGVPLHAIGVGAQTVRDIAVDVHAAPTVKRGEATAIEVTIRQTGLAGRTVPVDVSLVRISAATGEDAPHVIEQSSVLLDELGATISVPWRPEMAGKHRILVAAQPVEQETLTENNLAEREIQVIDDHLRLLYLAAEPNWEWRFIKEVFHRDELVGMAGFRTYLQSADPIVRRTNDLFLPGLTLPRSEFFQFDVLFLGDLPREAVSARFCEDVKEFVGSFGGGLVLVAGPNHGLHWLADSPLADLLPVVPAPIAANRRTEPFPLRLTPLASSVDFMQLGDAASETEHIWSDAGNISWAHPVSSVDVRSTMVLAEHPKAVCADGRTPQPILAIRRYGRGEVVYVGTDEMWRLRRLQGERYYRRLWGQMIHRLGFSHAIGASKRFVVRTDQQQYRPGSRVRMTVEAYDENFQPLEPSAPDAAFLSGRRQPPKTDLSDGDEPLRLSMVRPGRFETEVVVNEAGEHLLSVTDPVLGTEVATSFRVQDVSAERRTGVRNVNLQSALAASTGGTSSELSELEQVLDSIAPPPRQDRTIREISLWENWPVFLFVVSGLLSEWWLRKREGRP